MRVVLDTNILLSDLMTRGTPPDRLYEEWRHGRFDLVSTEQQIEELRAVTRRSFFQARLRPSEIGRMINDIRRLAVMCDDLPDVQRSPDPADDFLLALCEAAQADYLATGDKSHLLALDRHDGTRIVSARRLVDLLDQ
ncbi:MAG: putative toxin-antitoxin system toxin component, PIN family [Rhodocyclaceae bacterium]|nr:putative toxin-antitoxin system toxin component, PIN family [Rhodocyclaceae bacterium]MDZ4215715.1 putative toxin-antitoxin system toxin component, PIN family [Rhodocyclaceae bacterium]